MRVNYLNNTQGWEIGVGPTVVIVNEGVAKNLVHFDAEGRRLCLHLRSGRSDGRREHRRHEDLQDQALNRAVEPEMLRVRPLPQESLSEALPNEENFMSVGTILLIILIIALLGGFSGLGGGPFYGTGYYGGGGLGLVVIVLLILVVTGRL